MKIMNELWHLDRKGDAKIKIKWPLVVIEVYSIHEYINYTVTDVNISTAPGRLPMETLRMEQCVVIG